MNNWFKVSASTMGRPLTILGFLLWLVAASPLLVESDAYRYALLVLALIATIYYVREPDRPRVDWLGWLCMGWGLYVLLRFAFIYVASSGHDIGASDWLFAFPFFFPILGVAFALYEFEMERIIAAFFVIALAFLSVTILIAAPRIIGGEDVVPLVMHNQIHGAVACGIIFVASSYWLLYYLTAASAKPVFARAAYIVAPIVMLLCLIAIYGAKSKGVWLALGLTLPILAVNACRYIKVRGWLLIVFGAAFLLGGIYSVRHSLDKTAGPTVRATFDMAHNFIEGGDFGGAVTQTIQSTATPNSMDVRLQLWSNAWEVFNSAPIFGWGNRWLERWSQARYSGVTFTLLHNGYLEMLVRFGLFGMLVMGGILASFIVAVRRAAHENVVPRVALHAYLTTLFFFALTLLSNSNNRLAIGESFALVTSAFACWCHSRLRAGPA